MSGGSPPSSASLLWPWQRDIWLGAEARVEAMDRYPALDPCNAVRCWNSYIQHDGTEEGLANQLVEIGVPPQDIVLVFHEPEIRQYTDFGTG